jgi:hypothetical protein
VKTNKLKKFESKTASEPSPEQIKQAREWAVNRMMEVVDKLPANPAPVLDSFESLARQAKFGTPREITRIISGASEKKDENFVTKNNSGDAEKKDENFVTKFDLSELAILESLKNAEQ